MNVNIGEKQNEKYRANIKNEIADLDKLVKNGTISSLTAEKVKITKSIIENKYYNLFKRQKNHENNWIKIEEYLSTINTLSDSDKNDIRLLAKIKENKILKLFRKKISIKDFEIIKPIGKGGFGEVNICRYKEDKKIYAMKRITFEQLKYKNGLLNFQIEKDILSINNNSIWITQLRFSFIDNNYLYLIMDYCPGGDLMNYLISRDTLKESEARFYLAEIILCVDSLHKMHCIHRDLKPDNILIGRDGHIKLSDFGLSFVPREKLFPFTENKNEFIVPNLIRKKSGNYNENEKNEDLNNNIINNNDIKDNSDIISLKNYNKSIITYSNVGSPDYIAPEVIKNEGYGEEIDWWSVGAIFYEMLVGIPPFYSSSPQLTCSKIANFSQYLKIPDEVNISKEAEKIIFGFLNEPKKRLGYRGINEIKNKSFFKNFEWDKIREMKPPFIPQLNSPDDTKYFLNENINSNNSNNISNISKRINHRLKRTNIYFNRDINEESYNKNNVITFPKYCFQFNRDIMDIENNIYNELMNLIKTEIDERINKNAMENESIDEKSSTESLINISGNRLSTRTYSIEKYLNNNLFSPSFSSKLSYKTTLSDRKKTLNILPIRNLLNSKKNQELKSKNKSKKNNKDTKGEKKKGGKYYNIHRHK